MKSCEPCAFCPSAGSDEEYIYMNKVTVNKQQNAESQDKGRGLGRLPGGLAPRRGKQEVRPHLPLPLPSQHTDRPGEVIFRINILVDGILSWCIFGYFSRLPPPCPLNKKSVPKISWLFPASSQEQEVIIQMFKESSCGGADPTVPASCLFIDVCVGRIGEMVVSAVALTFRTDALGQNSFFFH